MAKLIVNVVEWTESGDKPKFRHTGETIEVTRSDLGVVEEHTTDVGIGSEYPLIIRHKKYITSDGKEIQNISMSHKLIGLISDYYLYNSSRALGGE